MPKMPIDIYSFPMSPPCRAVLMTARQLNIDLNVKNVDLSGGQTLTEEYLKINPAHLIPTINDKGYILWESRAIMRYLCNQYAPDSTLYPKDPKQRGIVDRFLDFDMTLMKAFKEGVLVRMIGVQPAEDRVKQVLTYFKLLDQLIGDNKYVTGAHLTIADLSLVSYTSGLESVGFDLTAFPNFKRWLSTMTTELPYFNEFNVFPKEERDEFIAKSQQYFKRKLFD